MNRENTQFIAGQYGINWCDQLAVYLICRELQRYLSCEGCCGATRSTVVTLLPSRQTEKCHQDDVITLSQLADVMPIPTHF